MDSQEKQSIEQACCTLLAEYAVAVDSGDGAAMAALFTPDGTLRRGDLTLRGPAEIPTILGKRPDNLVMRHLLTTIRIRVIDSANAEGLSYYMVYNGRGAELPLPMGQPFSIGDWRSRFVRTEAGWKLADQEIARTFVTK